MLSHVRVHDHPGRHMFTDSACVEWYVYRRGGVFHCVCDKEGRHNRKKRPETGTPREEPTGFARSVFAREKPTGLLAGFFFAREKPTGLLAVKFCGFVCFGLLFISFRSY